MMAEEGDYLFFDALHGSAGAGASNAAPQLRMGKDRATITNCLWE